MAKRPPVTAEKIAEVLTLHTRGLSRRQIAGQVDLCRAVVGRIVAGTYPLPGKPGKPVEKRVGVKFFRARSPVKWCEECGAHVRWPCLACQIREMQARAKVTANQPLMEQCHDRPKTRR